MAMKRLFIVLAALAGLTACGGGGGGDGGAVAGGDSFAQAVNSMVAQTSDTSEPVSIDAIAVTEVNDTDAPVI